MNHGVFSHSWKCSRFFDITLEAVHGHMNREAQRLEEVQKNVYNCIYSWIHALFLGDQEREPTGLCICLTVKRLFQMRVCMLPHMSRVMHLEHQLLPQCEVASPQAAPICALSLEHQLLPQCEAASLLASRPLEHPQCERAALPQGHPVG